MQSRQLELMEERDKVDKEAEMGQVMLLKKFGDVLRNTVVKMGDDVIEFIPFCDSIKRHFKELKVPDELRVSLLKPFLNESARLLVNRLDAVHQNDYDYVKKYLLDQFRLVPQYFLEMFNLVCRQPRDTYKAFIARLSLLLDYYLASRDVKTLDELKLLLVSDRIKATLHEGSLNHLLKVEASLPRIYASPDGAADILDTYYANFDSREKPRASALGVVADRSLMRQSNKPASQPHVAKFVSPVELGAASTPSNLSNPVEVLERIMCPRVRRVSIAIRWTIWLRTARRSLRLASRGHVRSVGREGRLS
jgi:hypothetical protein